MKIGGQEEAECRRKDKKNKNESVSRNVASKVIDYHEMVGICKGNLISEGGPTNTKENKSKNLNLL